MKKLPTFLLVALLATSLMACSTVKKFTGQRDDSILPGTREEILPPEAANGTGSRSDGQENRAVQS